MVEAIGARITVYSESKPGGKQSWRVSGENIRVTD
jgi:hypothetical protein